MSSCAEKLQNDRSRDLRSVEQETGRCKPRLSFVIVQPQELMQVHAQSSMWRQGLLKAHSLFLVATVALVLTGCASKTVVEPQAAKQIEIPAFESVAIVRADEIPSFDELPGAAEKTIGTVATGATFGGMAGLSSGIYLCGLSGPWVGACFAVVGGSGLLIGATAGLVNAILDIDESKHAKNINERLASALETLDLQGELHSRLVATVPSEYILDSQTADILVSPVLSQIDVKQRHENTMYLRMVGNLIFSWGEQDEEGYLGSASFEYDTFSAPFETWNQEDGLLYEEYLLDGVKNIAQQMTNRIVLRIETGPEILEVNRW